MRDPKNDQDAAGAPDADAERRAFLMKLAATTAALAVNACTSNVSYNAPPGSNPGGGNPGGPPPPPPLPGPNSAPVWQPLPAIAFTQGVASSFAIDPFVSDPDGDVLAITKNAAALPAGVTFDAPNHRFVYDGIGAAASTSGHVLTADDGRP